MSLKNERLEKVIVFINSSIFSFRRNNENK